MSDGGGLHTHSGISLLGGCYEHGSLLKCQLDVSAGSWTLYGGSSCSATVAVPTCSTPNKRLFNRGGQEGADLGGNVALRGDHMSFSVHQEGVCVCVCE